MSITQRIILASYQQVARTGLLESDVMQRFFWHAYSSYKKYLEDPFFKLGKNYPGLFKGGSVLDVGANIGYTARVFTELIDKECKVYTFEPELKNYQQLLKNNRDQITAGLIRPEHLAVGKEQGTVMLRLNNDHHADHKVQTEALQIALQGEGNYQEVAMVSIDGYLESLNSNEPIKFIKIDVQGYELAVCEGLKQTLVKNPAACVALEFSPESSMELGLDPRLIFDLFAELDMQCAIIHSSGKLALADIDQVYGIANKRSYIDLLFFGKASRVIIHS